MAKLQLDDNLYPMNQDMIPFDRMMYNHSVEFIAGYVRRQKGMSVDQIVAQVEKDLRMILDQKLKPQ